MFNMLKTFILLFALTALLMLAGEWIAGSRGMMYGLVAALGMNFVSYWFSDKIVLAMYRARAPQPSEQRAVALAGNLATLANLPAPRVMMIDTPLPNAFATGRNPQHAVVAVTTGILDVLNDRELTAVLAHELGHVRNRDILVGSIAATIAGAITFIARIGFFFGGGNRDRNALGMLLMLILAPLAAMLIQMAISRSREFGADRSSGELTHRPQDLISALEKLQAAVKRNPAPATEQASSTAHLFIVNPFKASGLQTLFSTHPSLEQRVARLQALEQELQGVPRGL